MTERAILSKSGNRPHLLTTSTHYDSYDDIMYRKKPFTNKNNLVNNLSREIAKLVDTNPGEVRGILDPFVDLIQQNTIWPLFSERSDGGDDTEFYLNPARIVFVPANENLKLCTSCFTPRYHDLDVTCIADGCNETNTFLIQEGDGQRYHEERLAVWSERVEKLSKPKAVPMIYRAEEILHRYQKLGRDDLFNNGIVRIDVPRCPNGITCNWNGYGYRATTD